MSLHVLDDDRSVSPLDQGVVFDLGKALGAGLGPFMITAANEIERELDLMNHHARSGERAAFLACCDRMTSVAAFMGAVPLTEQLRRLREGPPFSFDGAVEEIGATLFPAIAKMRRIGGATSPSPDRATSARPGSGWSPPASEAGSRHEP
ncbi:hypothetical protein E0K89_002795 [Aquicoccus sp. SCR17]|nr:hypothetical protein [Carideicomes alvinocaridis]